MQGVLRYFSVKRHKNDLQTGKYNFAKKNIICLAFPFGEGGPLAVEEVLLFLKFFDISVFTFETSIVNFVDTSPRRRTPPLRQTSSATSPVSSGEPSPRGEGKKVRFYSEKVLFKYLLLSIGAFHALKPCQYRYFIRLRRLLYVPRFEKRYPVTA